MYIKIHEAYRNIVAVSDKELIGKTFSEGKRQIEILPNFFEGELKTKRELLTLLKDLEKEDASFNIVGKKSVDVALEAGIISREGIITIDNVPVALKLL